MKNVSTELKSIVFSSKTIKDKSSKFKHSAKAIHNSAGIPSTFCVWFAGCSSKGKQSGVKQKYELKDRIDYVAVKKSVKHSTREYTDYLLSTETASFLALKYGLISNQSDIELLAEYIEKAQSSNIEDGVSAIALKDRVLNILKVFNI